jgi:anti-sigma factor RsiW
MSKPEPSNDDELTNLVAFLDGELNAEAARTLEARLSRDPAARAEADALKRTWDLLDFLPRPEPSSQFTHRTMERISVPLPRSVAARRRPWLLGLGWAAAVLLALGGGYFGARLASRGDKPVIAAEPADLEQQLVRDLRLIENKRLYDLADDLEFLWGLADPDLFGEES